MQTHAEWMRTKCTECCRCMGDLAQVCFPSSFLRSPSLLRVGLGHSFALARDHGSVQMWPIAYLRTVAPLQRCMEAGLLRIRCFKRRGYPRYDVLSMRLIILGTTPSRLSLIVRFFSLTPHFRLFPLFVTDASLFIDIDILKTFKLTHT